jgi:16S rRNA (guanine527-N7)-methyltransferase
MIGSEQEADEWIASHFHVSRETMSQLRAFAGLVEQENERQNLIARSSLPHIRRRHIADSAQLVRHAPADATRWLDLGSGAGFPGLIVALLWPGDVTLVESRRLRAEFLRAAASGLSLSQRLSVAHARLEQMTPRPFDVISARAFAPLDRLLLLATPFSTEKTRWILPKGRSAQSELDAARGAWQGDFRLEPSLTDPDAHIIVAEGVRPRKGRNA